jgi:hypothetical protein
MKFDLEYYHEIVRPDNRKLKYKFEMWLQDTSLIFESQLNKKIITKDQIDSIFQGIDMSVIGTHVVKNEETIRAGHNTYFCKCNKCGLMQRVAFGYAKDKNVICYGCFVERLYNEASEKGLELVGFSLDGDKKRRHYKFKCGHTRDISTGDVRAGNFSCTECRNELLESKLKEHNLTLIGRPDKSMCSDPTQFYYVSYNECGHKRIVTQQNLIGGSVGRCEICYEKELQAKYGTMHGVEILSKVSGAKREIKFNSCGHTRIVTLTNLKSGSFECNICKIEKWKQEADESGLEYIGPDESTGSGSKKKHLYKAPCNHILSLKQSAVREGHWTCRTCNSGYLDRFNYLYVFKITATDGFEFLKFGYSMKPEYRKYDYIVDKGTTFELVRKVLVPTGREAITLENGIHEKLKEFNLDKNFMKKYLTESGFTECYPLSVFNDLLNELDLVETTLAEEQYGK